jgi:hypothetical protein
MELTRTLFPLQTYKNIVEFRIVKCQMTKTKRAQRSEWLEWLKIVVIPKCRPLGLEDQILMPYVGVGSMALYLLD